MNFSFLLLNLHHLIGQNILYHKTFISKYTLNDIHILYLLLYYKIATKTYQANFTFVCSFILKNKYKKHETADIITFDKPSLMIFCGFQIGSCRKKKGFILLVEKVVGCCGYNDTIIIFLYASKKWDFNFTQRKILKKSFMLHFFYENHFKGTVLLSNLQQSSFFTKRMGQKLYYYKI